MGFLFQLPLDPLEEQFLLKFLKTSQHPSAAELQFLYLLQRGNYKEAINLTETSKHSMTREFSQIRNAFTENFKLIFPHKVSERTSMQENLQRTAFGNSPLKIQTPLL